MSAFNGSFVLDSAKSGAVDKLLTAQGLGFLQRSIVANLSQTVTITIDGEKVTIKQETSVKTTEFTLVLGAAPEAFKDELSGTDAKRSIKLEGDTLIQIVEAGNGTTTVARTIEDGGKVLKAHITFVPKSGETITVDRFFNKK